jgi:hypothetical protein
LGITPGFLIRHSLYFSKKLQKNYKREPRLIVVSGFAAHHNPDDDVGIIGKN